MTPDWAARPTSVPYAVFGDPQSLNLYVYVRNDPISRNDPDGHCMAHGEGDHCGPGSLADGFKMSLRQSEITAQGSETATPPEGEAQQQNTVSQHGQPKKTAAGHLINKDAIANYADQHAEKGSLGKCAAYCRRAFEAGGVDTSGHPVDAKDWGPTLLKNGAAVVSPDGYAPQKADVAVFAGSDSHPYGHITVYDGKQWVSDFKQRNMSPYRTAAPPVTIYRFPDN